MGDTGPLRFLSQHFTLGLHSFTNLHTIITSQFSHNSIFHFGINMYVLHSFGSTMLYTFGAKKFLKLYALSGLSCAATSLYYKKSMYDQRQGVPNASSGASGCISGVLASFTLLYPRATVTVLFFPMPAWVAFGGLVCYDIYNATKEVQGSVDAAGHLGGSLGGLLWYLTLR